MGGAPILVLKSDHINIVDIDYAKKQTLQTRVYCIRVMILSLNWNFECEETYIGRLGVNITLWQLQHCIGSPLKVNSTCIEVSEIYILMAVGIEKRETERREKKSGLAWSNHNLQFFVALRIELSPNI